MHALKGFSDWLAATALSASLQGVSWVVPTVQTLHLLAIAAVLSSASMISLRLAGVGARTQSMAAVAARFVPWVWYAVVVLAASGLILILVEPARPLTNPVFFLKLALIVAVALLMLVISAPLRTDSLYWERSARRRAAGWSVAALSWMLWVSVICAGRWIAYTLSAT
jgi:hypothetical protein